MLVGGTHGVARQRNDTRKLTREKNVFQPPPPLDRHTFDESWGYTHGNVVGETGVVCDWSAVREGSLDMPTCITGICGGHHADDILPFEVEVQISQFC